eukprot:3286268-Rhodomonas_salina.4
MSRASPVQVGFLLRPVLHLPLRFAFELPVARWHPCEIQLWHASVAPDTRSLELLEHQHSHCRDTQHATAHAPRVRAHTRTVGRHGQR